MTSQLPEIIFENPGFLIQSKLYPSVLLLFVSIFSFVWMMSVRSSSVVDMYQSVYENIWSKKYLVVVCAISQLNWLLCESVGCLRLRQAGQLREPE